MKTAEEIAAELTKAQRQVLTGELMQFQLRVLSYRGVLNHLRMKGLQSQVKDYLDPTPLGLAVRAHLQKDQSNGKG